MCSGCYCYMPRIFYVPSVTCVAGNPTLQQGTGQDPVLDHSRDETRFFETVRYTVRAEDKQAQRGICLSPNQANPVRSPLGAKCAFSLQDGLPRGQLRGNRRITTPRRRSIRYPANYEDSDASQCLCGRWIGLSRFYVLVACQDVCIFDA